MSSTSSWPPGYAMENSSQPLLNVCISFAILETFFIIAFVFSWYFHNGNNNKSVFYLVLLGYLFCFAGVVIGILKITIGGAGYHAKTLRPRTLRTMLQLIKAHEFIYVTSLPLPKLALLCLYKQLFRSKLSHYIIYLTGLIIVATCIFGIVSGFANCRPFSAFWDRRLHARCTMDVMNVFRYYSIPNIVSDAILLLLPLPALRKLQVGIMTKIGVYLTFLTMTFGIITAALRFVSFLNIDIFGDITYLCIQTTSWTIIEPGVYLLAATMPTLRPLIRRIFKEANEFCPVTRSITRSMTSCMCQSVQSTNSIDIITQPRRVVHKKSSKSLHKEFFETIGRRPTRSLHLDDYHQMQDKVVLSPRSLDEESMVCADASTQERYAREDRNPDGTLRVWSLQPVQLSPLRTSFFYANN